MKKYGLIAFIFLFFTAASYADEPVGFSVNGRTVQPACLALFNQKRTPYPVIVGVDINRCQSSNNIPHMTKTDNERVYFLYQSERDTSTDGYYGYKVIGKGSNGTYVVHSFSQLPGDDSIYDALLFIQLSKQKVNIYTGLKQPIDIGTTKMLLVGYMPGGDRCSGGIKSAVVKGDVLTVYKYPAINSVNQCVGAATSIIQLP